EARAVWVSPGGEWIEHTTRSEVPLLFGQQGDGVRRGGRAANMRALVSAKPPHTILLHRTAGRAARLMLNVQRFGGVRGLEEVPCVEGAVAQKLERRPVDFIGSAARDYVDHGAGRGPVFRREIGR